VIAILTERVASQGCHFGYVGEEGEDFWGGECKGKHQSPIDINSENVTRTNLPRLKMNGFDNAFPAMIINNGHTALMTLTSDNKPTISGGPLKAEYEFAQLHFHWGANDTCGSEDQMNHKRYPLELHLVFVNKRYSDFNSALTHWDGLCVLGCLFEVQDDDNDNFNSFSKVLPQITKPSPVGESIKSIALFDLLPTVLTSYYTYNGSLTTPPCSEAVTWIDFDNTVKISHAQLQLFRNLVDDDDNRLINNFRAIQPLGDRTVYYSTDGIGNRSLTQKLKRVISIVAEKIRDICDLLKSVL